MLACIQAEGGEYVGNVGLEVVKLVGRRFRFYVLRLCPIPSVLSGFGSAGSGDEDFQGLRSEGIGPFTLGIAGVFQDVEGFQDARLFFGFGVLRVAGFAVRLRLHDLALFVRLFNVFRFTLISPIPRSESFVKPCLSNPTGLRAWSVRGVGLGSSRIASCPTRK